MSPPLAIRWYRVDEVIADFIDPKTGYGYCCLHTPQTLGPASHRIVAGKNRFEMEVPGKGGQPLVLDVTDSTLAWMPLPPFEGC